VADQRITQLTKLAQVDVAANDVLPIVDVGASTTKKVEVKELFQAGANLADSSSIDLIKLNQASTTKLGTTALADDAITAAKLANDSSIAYDSVAPTIDNFEGRGYVNSTSKYLQVWNGSSFDQVVAPTAGIDNLAITTGKLVDGAVTTAKVTPLSSGAYADSSIITAKINDAAVTAAKIATNAVTTSAVLDGAITASKVATSAISYDKLQNTTTTDVVLGRSSAGGGIVQEIAVTAAGRALIDDATAAAQRTTLGLGDLATSTGTWTNGSSFAGTSTGTNTGDQTITLTGDVTGTGTGSFATTVSTAAISEGKLATNAVTTGKINAKAVTAAKLGDNSGVIVAADVPAGSGAFVGQQWVNTNTGFEYTWTGAVWQRLHGISTIAFTESGPLAFAVSYPDNFSSTIAVTLDTQPAAQVFAGPTTGANAAPTFRAIVPGDLPDATGSTKGVIQPGTGLAVAAGTINHANAVSGSTVSSITFDNQGHITAAVPLVEADIPSLAASKITSGTFATAFIADDSITGVKLADYATAKIGETLPVADHIGQIFFNPLDKAFFLWDGNVWQPIGISAGAIIFGGTYDASTNLVASTTTEGAAIGLSVGSALPAASNTNTNYYVVVAEGGTGTSPAPTVALAPPDLLLSNGASWLEIDVSSTYVAQTASNIAFNPAGQVGATTVQAAIEEVSSECRNATNITGGTLAVARGGTGIASYAKGNILAASAATTLDALTVGTNGQVLRANSGTATGLEWSNDFVGTVTTVSSSTAALTVATATTTPALTVRSATTSVDGIVQLSDSTSTTSSVLAATPTAVKAAYDLADAALPKAGGIISGALEIGNTGSLVFEGSTADGNETTLTVADPTADQTITLPNATGTVALTSDLNDGTF
jgi:hypothetical protein